MALTSSFLDAPHFRWLLKALAHRLLPSENHSQLLTLIFARLATPAELSMIR